MNLELTDWDRDLPPEADEEYQAFIRTLRLTEGFGLLFVRCSPAGGEKLIAKVKEDVPYKNIAVLRLERPVNNLYELINNLENKEQINILFITGLEHSFYEYEECKRLADWNSKDIYSYSWKGVPPVLINLNQQRERFRNNFNICFVFLLPQFAVKYFIQRAPDFFDWRSGIFEFPIDPETLEQESSRILLEGDYEKYLALTPEERTKKILEIQELIVEDHQTPSRKAVLLVELGNLHLAAQDYEEAIASYDQAIKFKPDFHQAWYNRGHALKNLGRYEEAIASFDQAIKFKPDDHQAWYNRGNALGDLGRYEEAIASYDQAIKFKPDDHDAWYNRGNALGNLGRYEEAIASYDQAIKFKPDDHDAWYNKACCYALQANVEQAIKNLQTAISFYPEYREKAKTDSDFDSIRGDGRFQALIQEMVG
ncbi:MAG: tetratricopeptide repeat protein [Chlorogloeopsis fritschii C42_A2020_084]|uniref:tetratricopeptide repeat protein n=1 Tax=Chlorogloeopsis fritschii TaxID=1124 RepID=UPI0019DE6B72|nr:tetratricopeptide repeat protein [Chlorogloeopsis fritschii]MBF2006103.1 tetratricopeptide repeat protein [Chlorogloeopsis fritschii C42_A2020_084]